MASRNTHLWLYEFPSDFTCFEEAIGIRLHRLLEDLKGLRIELNSNTPPANQVVAYSSAYGIAVTQWFHKSKARVTLELADLQDVINSFTAFTDDRVPIYGQLLISNWRSGMDGPSDIALYLCSELDRKPPILPKRRTPSDRRTSPLLYGSR